MRLRTLGAGSLLMVLLVLGLAAVQASQPRQAAFQAPPPSITPLFLNGAPGSLAPYGSSGASAQASVNTQPTLAPNQPGVTSQQVVTAVPGSVQIIITPTAAGIPTIAAPTTVDPAQSEGIVYDVFNTIVVPVINLVLSFINGTIVTLWNLAGAQGGFAGQALCCIAPAIVLGWYFLFRRGPFRRR